jgi:hypothetical protein
MSCYESVEMSAVDGLATMSDAASPSDSERGGIPIAAAE